MSEPALLVDGLSCWLRLLREAARILDGASCEGQYGLGKTQVGGSEATRVRLESETRLERSAWQLEDSEAAAFSV